MHMKNVCEYKSHYNGFEWWTGREWSDNKELFRSLLDKDSKVESLKDLYYRHKDYYKELKKNGSKSVYNKDASVDFTKPDNVFYRR